MARLQWVDRARTRIQALENQSFQGVCKQERSPHPHSGPDQYCQALFQVQVQAPVPTDSQVE